MDLSLTCVDLQPDLDYPHWGCTIYAITVKNVIVSGLFMCIAVSRCALEINLTTLATDAPGMCRVQLVGIRCGVYAVHQNSLLSPSRRANHAPSADTGRWKLPTRPSRSFMVHFSRHPISIRSPFRRSWWSFSSQPCPASKVSCILRTTVQNATVYSLVIFASRFVLEMTLLSARVSISTVCVEAILKFLQLSLQLLPAM